MSEHFKFVCEHGTVASQCRCPSPDKAVKIVPCPPHCDASPPGGDEPSEEYSVPFGLQLLKYPDGRYEWVDDAPSEPAPVDEKRDSTAIACGYYVEHNRESVCGCRGCGDIRNRLAARTSGPSVGDGAP